MTADTSWLRAQSIALHEAVHHMFAAIKAVKRMVGERRSRPRTILSHIEALEAQLETIYIEACAQEIALHDMAKIAQELQRAYDQLLTDTEAAYQDGWNDALKQVLENAPGDGGILVAWLIHILMSDTAWREPAWDGVIELIREARHYLDANSEA